jgi:predicted metal-dependent hydrolase
MDLGYRWGSCSADGTLNFHWRVMQLPPRIIEYIVVHELAHIKTPDHTERFWQTLGSAMPDYVDRKTWLKKKGGAL